MRRVKQKCVAVAIAILTSAAPALLADVFPAGVQGTWKVVRKLDVPGSAAQCGGALPNLPKGAKVTIGDHTLMLEGRGMDDAQPTVTTLTAAQFTQKYLGGSEAAFKHLGLRGSSIEVITPTSGAEGTEFTVFDTVIVKDPSTLLLGRCGRYFEATHAGGFQAPRLPD